MEVVLRDLESKVHEKLRAAFSVTIAVAYFRPDDKTLDILKKIPRLRIIVSNEFDKSDPYKLEEASEQSKCIPVFPNRLHAKVIYGESKEGDAFAFVGSANLTPGGLTNNQEACVIFDSRDGDDKGALGHISGWLETLYKEGKPVDFQDAKKIFDNASYHPSGKKEKSTIEAKRHWTIKTRDGREKGAKDYWNKFRSERVIALGWGNELKIDPREVNHGELRARIQTRYGCPSNKAGRISTEIMQFAGLEDGLKTDDVVWVIGSFATTQIKPIYVYGIALVGGELQCDWKSGWWNFKRGAKIFPIERPLDIEEARKCFGMKAMVETLYSVPANSFEKLCNALHRKHGISINL